MFLLGLPGPGFAALLGSGLIWLLRFLSKGPAIPFQHTTTENIPLDGTDSQTAGSCSRCWARHRQQQHQTPRFCLRSSQTTLHNHSSWADRHQPQNSTPANTLAWLGKSCAALAVQQARVNCINPPLGHRSRSMWHTRDMQDAQSKQITHAPLTIQKKTSLLQCRAVSADTNMHEVVRGTTPKHFQPTQAKTLSNRIEVSASTRQSQGRGTHVAPFMQRHQRLRQLTGRLGSGAGVCLWSSLAVAAQAQAGTCRAVPQHQHAPAHTQNGRSGAGRSKQLH